VGKLGHEVEVANRWATFLVSRFRPRSGNIRLAVKDGREVADSPRQTRAFKVLIALCMTVMVGSVLGCGSAGPPGSSTSTSPREALSPAEVVMEIKAESKTLQLAPGWTWPADEMPQSKGPDGRSVVYQVGYGTTWADHYWYCSWEWRLVKGGLTPTERDQTVAMLATVRSKEYYIVAVDEIDKVKFDKELNDAIHGSLKTMQADVAVNCDAAPS